MIFRVAVSIMKMGKGRLGRSKFDRLVEVDLASKNMHGLLLGGSSPERLIQVVRHASSCFTNHTFVHQSYKYMQSVFIL